jgi:hypothetical protein
MSNSQRALWTFLMFALVGPFFAALSVVIVVALASIADLAGHLPGGAQDMGAAGLTTFVWAAVPSVVTGLVLAGVVLRAGGFSWFMAALVAIIVFSVATEVMWFTLQDIRVFLTPLAGLVAVAVREMLIRAQILPA